MVLDDGRLFLVVVDGGRLVLAINGGIDVSDVVSDFVAEQVVDEIVNLLVFSLNCFVEFSRTQFSPSISSGPTNQPEGNSISGLVTKPPMQSV